MEPIIVSAAPVPLIVSKRPIFHQEDVRVSDDGGWVEVRIGNSVITLDYEDALKISQMIRVHAKRAKRRVGDVSRHWSAVADIENINDH